MSDEATPVSVEEAYQLTVQRLVDAEARVKALEAVRDGAHQRYDAAVASWAKEREEMTEELSHARERGFKLRELVEFGHWGGDRPDLPRVHGYYEKNVDACPMCAAIKETYEP